jgi:predicted nucleic acid-binding protein
LLLKEKYHYSWWDSLVLASALENGCQIVYSEDMQHEQVIEDSLKIINPFLE